MPHREDKVKAWPCHADDLVMSCYINVPKIVEMLISSIDDGKSTDNVDDIVPSTMFFGAVLMLT